MFTPKKTAGQKGPDAPARIEPTFGAGGTGEHRERQAAVAAPSANGLWYGFIATAVTAGLVAGAWYWTQRSSAPVPPPASAPQAAAAKPPVPAPAPAILHPIEAAAPAELPALAESDKFVTAALNELLGSKAVLTLLQTDGFVRRAVATVDNLARAHAAVRLWPVNPMPGRFAVTSGNVIKPNNDERYTAFVLLVESVDAARAVALYVRLYPLFQRAYAELGYPDRYFNDRLVEVIDILLATPVPQGALQVRLTEIRGEIKSQRPWVRYEFADPALQGLTAGQKMMLRSGAVNERRLKAKLAEVRRLVAKVENKP